MTYQDFFRKHPMQLTDPEREFCGEAMEIIRHAADVHHDHTHIERMLGYLDEFLASPDFKAIELRTDLKIVFMAIIGHDLWRSQRDAHTAIQLLWYMFLERWGGPRVFYQLARRHHLENHLASAVGYCIEKHTHFIIFPLRTIEAKILKAIDELDYYSDERIALLEKKFLLDRPITEYYLTQAKLATRLYIQADTAPTHYFPWIESRILARKQLMLDRLRSEIEDYAILLKYKNKKHHEAYERQFDMMKQKFQL